ncbi:glycosyltransferase [Psychrobacter sp. AOP22-C1-22]|uniref:glycosyltransferase n=1 Tax=unclassified Psychrobacter TaxID=196806 RepID=UPI0017882E27|nr:glycosyltransferase [Psychrobacter sp. FME6]MBE0407090.1 glycosyltransferase [Psychrobacter sp. FME6]
MKIVHVIIGLNVGGAELMLKRLVLNSSQKGEFEHVVISLTDLGVIGADLQSQGIKVYSLGMRSALTIPHTSVKLRKLLKFIKPDVVQTWMYHADLLGGLAARSLGIENIIWGIRNTELNTKKSFSRQAMVNLCAKLSYTIPSQIACVANTAMDTHIKQGGYDASKMLVIPNGFDINKFKPNEIQRLRLRSKLNIKSDELVIGNIGRFDPVKNHENFIKACIKLLQKGYKFKVLLAGRDVDLNNPAISKLFKNSSLYENFIFLGEIDDTASFYNAIDAFCLCSYTEGFPNVLGEAMATEKVCLATDAGDAWVVLSNNGFRIDSNSSADIAIALETNVLNKALSDPNDIGNAARIAIVNNYSIDKIVSQFESLYIR